MKNANDPAFPIACPPDFQFAEPSLTKREYAAITLRVPNSGDHALDAMIRSAERRDMAAMAMQAIGRAAITAEIAAEWSVKLAGTLIAELAKAEPETNAPDSDDDDCVIWTGGERPVPADCIVKVFTRSGMTFIDSAGGLYWDHAGEDGDIMRYRIVEGGAA